jgi:glycosyl hydrolase family 42 (putative beta-galactosidase)
MVPTWKVAPRPAALIAALFFTAGIHAQTRPADLRGVYVYTNDVSRISKPVATALTTSLGIPGMDGIVIVIGWSAIEPSPDQYQWVTLDSWIHQANSLGKKIDLIVTAGSDMPSWLFDAAPAGAGAKPLQFTISPHAGATGLCQPEIIAAPWDPAFLSRWDSMLSALSAHLKAIGAYDSITLLRITGINRTTDELRLPAETAQSTGLACVSDSLTTWQNAGYKPSRLVQAWDAITSSFQKSFPDKSFSIAIIPVNAFPAIGEDGAVIKGSPPDQNTSLISLAGRKFPGRLVVQFNFLMPGEAASPAVIGFAQTFGTMAAFQTNEYFGTTGQGAACSEPVTNPTPCTAETFMALMKTGIYPQGVSGPLRAQYIEVFHANATAFPGDILQAHDELIPRRRAARQR